jgi:hypothetical protein
MARLKVPGGRKLGRPPKKQPNTQQSKSKLLKQKKKQSKYQEIKPHVISVRRYQEIFGSSDDEVIQFVPAPFCC